MYLCFVVTVPFVLNAFVAPAISSFVRKGWKVTVVLSGNAADLHPEISARVETIDLRIARYIDPVRDLYALWYLYRLFRRRKFNIIHSITPKAGLLAMLAARAARVPIRIHTFTGQVWVSRTGAFRWLLRLMDKLIAYCATALLVDSPSQRDFLVAQGVAAAERLYILGQGSITGVDTMRFAPNPSWRTGIRTELDLPRDAIVIVYVGRMHPEKGVHELCLAFAQLASKISNVFLLLVGPDEGALGNGLLAAGAFRERIRVVGLTLQPEKYMAAADIFCLASYREGFGLSLIEAAAVGLPCVASHIYGVTDAIVDGVTGILVKVKDVRELAMALALLAEQPILRQQMSANARERVKRDFSQESVLGAWITFYQKQLLLEKPDS